MPLRLQGWGGFAAWSGAGALVGISLIGAASIGLFVLPAAVLACAAAGSFVRPWPEVTGVIVGLASPVLLVGALNVGSTPCPSSGTATSAGPTVSCGGFDPVPWLVVGSVLAGIGLTTYLRARAR